MTDEAFMDASGLQIADDGEPSGGKYFQVTIPRYSGEEGDMHCFLRLGKNAAEVGAETYSKIGKELWAIFDTFYDTGAHPVPALANSSAETSD
jgi:hypothetical protein